jgi:hypothetical protein
MFITIALMLAAAPESPRFVGTRTDGMITPAATLADALIAKPSLITISQVDMARPAWPTRPHAMLVNGDRIAGTLLHGTDSIVSLDTLAGAIPIPLTTIDILWIAERPADESPFSDRSTWLTAPRKQDALWLANRDTITGTLEAFSDLGRVKIMVGTTSRVVPKDRILAVAMNPALTSKRPAAGLKFRIVFADGSRITATAISLETEKIVFTPAFDSKIKFRVAESHVIAIDCIDNTVIELDSLVPAKVEQTPFISIQRPWQRGRTMALEQLSTVARGIESFHDSGIGIDPTTTLKYDLTGKFERLIMKVSVDDRQARTGSATVIIRTDDIVRERLTVVPGPPILVSLPLEAAKSLSISAEAATLGRLSAPVQIIQPVLIKARGAKSP